MENYIDNNRIAYSFNMCKELHEIDTNCNTCVFLEPDFEKFKYWE